MQVQMSAFDTISGKSDVPVALLSETLVLSTFSFESECVLSWDFLDASVLINCITYFTCFYFNQSFMHIVGVWWEVIHHTSFTSLGLQLVDIKISALLLT